MLKERHRYRGVPLNTPRRRSNIVPLENVGIVPANRFILLPLKKVSTIVHRHRCCRATDTKTCIVQKATMVSQPVLFQPSVSEINVVRPRSARRRRVKRPKHHPALSPVSEQDQESGGHFLVDHWRQPPVERVLKAEIPSPGQKENGLKLDLVSKRAATLSQELEKEKERDLHREVHTRIRQDPALDQLRFESFKRLVDELQKRIAEAERDSALKQESTALRGAQQQRRGNKRLRKIVLRIHTFGRNRVAPSSGPVFQLGRRQQRFVLPGPPVPVEIPARARSWNSDDFHGVSYADVQSKQKFLKMFICSCTTSSDDLPIGPLEEELLN